MNNPTTKTTTTTAQADLDHSPDALAQRRAELLALLAQTAPELISDNPSNVAKLQLELKALEIEVGRHMRAFFQAFPMCDALRHEWIHHEPSGELAPCGVWEVPR